MRILSGALVVVSLWAALGSVSAQQQEPRIDLSRAERALIYKTVARMEPPGTRVENLLPGLGESLPPSVQLYELPADAVTQIPSLRAFRHAVIGEEIVIVDPGSRKVLAIVRRPSF